MKRTLITLCIIINSLSVLSAKGIKGIVIDSDSIPVEFANITAFADDSVVGGDVTDKYGQFSIDVGSDCNKIRVSFVGYDDAVINAVSSDMGKIILKQTSTTLREVVVKAPLIRREADRIVMNVAANPLSTNVQPPAHDISEIHSVFIYCHY